MLKTILLLTKPSIGSAQRAAQVHVSFGIYSDGRRSRLVAWRNYSATFVCNSTSQQPSFQYPKAEELYHRILARCKTKEDARALQRTVYELLGRPLRDFEFYYDGFGGKKTKKDAGAGSGDKEPEIIETPKIFDVKLVGYDAAVKLKVIKEIRTILPGLGLKEAKELVESAPCILQKGLQPEQAEAMKTKLVELGAQVELV
jgi:large subunit ribosomal protein L7/L12